MARRRPYRALAFKPDASAPNGRKRQLVGRTSACTREGLQPFIDRHQEQGHVVDVLDVKPLPLFAEIERDHHGAPRY